MFDLSFFKQMISVFITALPILAIVLLVIIVICFFKFHIKFKYKTFFHRGFIANRGKFGLYCYTGAQGRGKTYSLVEYMIDNSDKIIVYSNVLNIKNVKDIHYYTGFKELMEIKEQLDNHTLVIPKGKQLVIVYDEIFLELMRGDKLSKPVLDFLCQMRKRKIVFLTTAQYWSPIPIDFRRFCRYQIDCRMYNVLFFSVLVKVFHDAENMKWDDSEQDFVAPILETTITKCRKRIANSYDTFLRVSPIANYKKVISSDIVKDKEQVNEVDSSLKKSYSLDYSNRKS